MKTPRFAILDICRGMAALWVMLLHASWSSVWQREFPYFANFKAAGFHGVDIFFVVSGYCIARSAADWVTRSHPWHGYLQRRLVRIYPPFWYSIAFIVSQPYLKYLLAKVTKGSAAWPQPPFAAYGIGDWAGIASLLGHAYRFPSSGLISKFEPINIVYWTLAIEVQFYLVVAFSLIFPKHWLRLLLLVTLGSVPIAVLGLPRGWNTGLFLPYWPSFACGLLLWWLHQHQITLKRFFPNRGRAIGLLIAGGLLAAVVAVLAAGQSLHPLVFAGIFATGLWCLLDTNWAAESEKRFPLVLLSPFLFLGAMSYSVYLIHFNLGKATELLLPSQLAQTPMLRDVVSLCITLVLIVPFYFLCDRPYARGQRDLLVRGIGQLGRLVRRRHQTQS